jgi:hypothetical protein
VSVQSSDLVIYNALNNPTTDSATGGGAIDTLRRPDFTQMSSTEKIDVKSSNAGDTTQTVTLTGRTSDGTLASETLTLNGTTIVTSANTYERVLIANLSATTTGSITVSGHTSSTTFRTIPAGERGFQAIFQQGASDPSVQKDYFNKVFIKNTNGSLALTSATVKENADPDARITFSLAASLNDSATITNRLTSPGGSFTSGTQNVANGQSLSSGSAQGVWLDLTLPAADASHRTTYTLEIDGQTV